MIPLPAHAACALPVPATTNRAAANESRAVSAVLRRHIRRRKLRWYR